jgi:hypothetical protein
MNITANQQLRTVVINGMRDRFLISQLTG